MRIKIVTMAKVKQSHILDGEAYYTTRLKGQAKFEFMEMPVGGVDNLSVSQRKAKESSVFLSRVRSGETLIVLDEHGQEHDSVKFAEYLGALLNRGSSEWCFAIGGAYGWDKSVLTKADMVLSLSRLTLPYSLARLVLVEQLYRAFCQLRGIPYHKA